MFVDTSDHYGKAKRTSATGLGELLHQGRDLLGHIVNRGFLVVSQTVILRTETSVVDDDSSISIEAGKRTADVLVNNGYLLERGRFLELFECLLFHGQNNLIFGAETDGAIALFTVPFSQLQERIQFGGVDHSD